MHLFSLKTMHFCRMSARSFATKIQITSSRKMMDLYQWD